MEYSIKPKILGERRIIHYPQKRIIGLYVCDMCLTEFDEKKYEDVLREEGREEGLAEGIEKGLAKGRSEERKTLLEIVQKLKEGKTPEQLVEDGMEKESVDSAIMLRKLL